MTRVGLSLLRILMLLLAMFMSACVTIPPKPEVKANVIAKTGTTVHLFHGGNKVAKDEFCLNEVVPVYRYFGRRYKQPAEIGKVKITGYVGDHYLEGVVVEGKIKEDDVAMKLNSACLIKLPESDEK